MTTPPLAENLPPTPDLTHPPGYTYRLAGVKRVIDGDTYDLILSKTIDFGFYLIETKTYAVRVRLNGVDTPEHSEPQYLDALSYAARWLTEDRERFVKTFKTDSFGRWLASIYDAETGDRLSDALLEAGLAVPYRR